MVELDTDDVTNSRVDVSINATSINTRDDQRDAHLKSADFLEVKKFPTLTFASARITRKDDGEVAVEDDLTITE